MQDKHKTLGGLGRLSQFNNTAGDISTPMFECCNRAILNADFSTEYFCCVVSFLPCYVYGSKATQGKAVSGRSCQTAGRGYSILFLKI